MINLDRNENNYGPAPECYNVLRRADIEHLSYYSVAYRKGYKSILSQRLSEDFNIDEKRIVLGYGAEDLLKQVVQCYLNENEKLMIPSYSWWYYKKIASEVGAVNVEYPLIKKEDEFVYDVETFIKIYRDEKPKVLFISSPNNPTGNRIENDQLIAILEEAKDSVVVLDEAYLYQDTNELVLEALDKYPNFIVLRTFSKYFALAGVRIGYGLLGKNHDPLSSFANRYLGYNRLSEEIAIAALDAKEYYKGIAKKMDDDKKSYYKELGKIEGFTVFKSEANFVLVEIPEEIKDSLKSFLTQREINIKFMNEDALNKHLRITLGTQEENRKVIDAINEFALVNA
ncbi:MAG: histidinol-phosphate aminotransferase family protein [Chlorobi bacterium]|nr:histidinol-phosphate aminotransferase family protein [Chlorobiota bacterium]